MEVRRENHVHFVFMKWHLAAKDEWMSDMEQIKNPLRLLKL